MQMKERGAAIRAYLENKREEITGVLSALAAIPSVKGEATADAPCGVACKEALDQALAVCREAGAVTVDRGSYGLADFGEGEAHVGIFTHLDVVPAGDGWKGTAPFSPCLKGDYLFGRGVTDDKSGFVAALYAYRALADLSIAPRHRMRIFLGADEESGMCDIGQFLKDESRLPDVSLVPDGSFPVSAGEKGICRFSVNSPAFTDVLSVKGGVALNVVLAHAEVLLKDKAGLYEEIAALVEGEADLSVKRTDDGILLLAEGIPSHASMPEHSKNAFYGAARLLSGVRALAPADREIFREAASLLKDSYGTAFGIATEDEAFGRLTATNGIVAGGGDKGLYFTFDVRYGTGISAEELERRVLRTVKGVGLGWRGEIMENDRGFKIPTDSPYLALFCRVYSEASGKPCAPQYMGGGTYARHLPTAFSIGTSAPYVEGAFIDPEDDNRIHSADEYIHIPAFLEAVALVAEMLLAADAVLSEKEGK